MFNLKDVKFVMDKVRKDAEPGEVLYVPEGRPEIRYEYILDDELAFTFGLTRVSKGKSKQYSYIPRNIGITNKEWRGLRDCSWNKSDLNNKLRENR